VIYLPNENIKSFDARDEYISVLKIHSKVPLKPMERKTSNPLSQWGCEHLIHPILDRPHSSPQTTSSQQPFFHNSTTRQTDTQTGRQTLRPTDGIGVKSVTTHACALYIDYSDAANNKHRKMLFLWVAYSLDVSSCRVIANCKLHS